MNIENNSECENTSLKLKNDCASHTNEDLSEENSESKQNLIENNSVPENEETSMKDIAENGKSTDDEDAIKDKYVKGKVDDSGDKGIKSDEKKLELKQCDLNPESSLSSDEQEEKMSNGFDNDLNENKNKSSGESKFLSEDTKDKENIKKNINNSIKSEANHLQTRSFSVITKVKQNAKKSIGQFSNSDKTEKSFVLSEVTDDDIEQIRDDSCFPDYLKSLLSVGRYIPVQIVNPRDYRPKNNETLIEAPSLTVPLLVKERNIYFDKTYKIEKKHTVNTQDNYFASSVGQFLIGLGFSRVREWYHRDMTKVKERQIRKSTSNSTLENELQEHKNEYFQAKQANDPFMCSMKKCHICSFQTESHLVLEGHYLIPHISPRREYLCNFCTFSSRDPKMMMFHMEAIHNKHAVIDLPVFYECPFCLFDTHLKTRLTQHLIRCQRQFRSSLNQAPIQFLYPTLTPKPVTTNDIKEYEASLSEVNSTMPYSFKNSQKLMVSHASGNGSNRPVIPSMSTLYQQLTSVDYQQQLHHFSSNNVQLLPNSGGAVRTKYPTMNQLHCGQSRIPFPISSNHIYHFINTNGQLVPVLGKDLINSTSRLSFLSNSMENSSQQKKSHYTSSSYDTNSGTRMAKLESKKNVVTIQSSENKSLSMTNLPRLQGPHGIPSSKSSPQKVVSGGQSSKVVICEICDGYIKDLEQLQTHMHWIHKVKIHPKMLASRPPLNCQKCQSRFFTDQGLERHLLGTHGLVTPNMQDMANKNQDGGCCTICRQFYACKLVAHISQVHKITLKPAHLSYKCTVCSATFSLYRQFENHVYSVHSGSGKRSLDAESSQTNKKMALDKNKLKLVEKSSSSSLCKSKLVVEKSASPSKIERSDLIKKHTLHAKEKGKHSLQSITSRLKRRKYLRSSDGTNRGKET